MNNRYGKKDKNSDSQPKPDFMDPAYIDEAIVRIVRSHITNGLYSNTDLITDYARKRMQYYLCTRENVPDNFWDQSMADVLKRSTSGVSRSVGEAVSDAFEVIQSGSIDLILKKEQRGTCRQQVQGRFNKSIDSVKLLIRDNLAAASGAMTLKELESETPDEVRLAAKEGTPFEFSCDLRLKPEENRAVQKWKSDLSKKRKEHEKNLHQANLEKKKKMERELAQQEKVLTAIPKRYRDLYPRARTMKRHFRSM